MATFDDEHKKYNESLKRWENFLGLPTTEPERTEIDFILNIKRSEITSVPTQQLSEYTFMLMQYAFFLQQKSNECKAFLDWTQYVMGRLRGDSVAKATNVKRQVEMRFTRIGYLARRIEMMAQAINNICRTRYNEGKNHESN